MGLQKSLFLSANEQQEYNTHTNSHPFIPSFKMIKALAAKFSIDLQQHTLPTMFIQNIIIYVKENNTHIKRYGYQKKVSIHCDIFKSKNLH